MSRNVSCRATAEAAAALLGPLGSAAGQGQRQCQRRATTPPWRACPAGRPNLLCRKALAVRASHSQLATNDSLHPKPWVCRWGATCGPSASAKGPLPFNSCLLKPPPRPGLRLQPEGPSATMAAAPHSLTLTEAGPQHSMLALPLCAFLAFLAGRREAGVT